MEKTRVLIVDDNVTLARTLQAGLRLQGHMAEAATDAHAAFVLLRTQPFDIALLDIQMPDLNGFTLGRMALGTPLLRGIIFMTGQRPEQVSTEVMRIGGRHLLTKPFRLGELYAIIDAIMTQEFDAPHRYA